MTILINITEKYKKATLSNTSLVLPKEESAVATRGYQPGGPFNDIGQSATSGVMVLTTSLLSVIQLTTLIDYTLKIAIG